MTVSKTWLVPRLVTVGLASAMLTLAGCGGSGGSTGGAPNANNDGVNPGNDFSSESLPGDLEPRPGPDILYAAPANAPQLQNTGVWRAPPILVSGASAYRSGEFLYQDYLYDDHGANGVLVDPGDPRLGDNTFSMPGGTYTYPSGPAYANNAADLVEFRVKPLADATAFRVTLNTLLDPDKVAFTLALGESDSPRAMPHGANAQVPAALFLTVHGNQAELLDAQSGESVLPGPSVSLDTLRRQYTVRVPHAVFNPGRASVPMALGVGLWDTANDQYLVPQPTASATRPGGAGTLPAPPAFFNVAFRFEEPLPDVTNLAATAATPAWWRDQAQAQALSAGDLSGFVVDVDFARLADEIDDDMTGQPQGVPESGVINRIFASRFELEQGVVYPSGCGGADACEGSLRGQLRPYALYLPAKPRPENGYGLTLLLHSLGGNYNQYSGSRNQSQLGERGAGHIVITPSGLGPDGWYVEYAGAETFEVWADVARHYRLNPKRTVVTGYSMGGYGTFRFATRYPDLFARAQTTVGPPGIGAWVPPGEPSGGARSNSADQLEGLRNIPILMWVMVADELVPYVGTVEQANRIDALGYRYAFDSFTPGEHLTLAINDQYAPVADFLGDAEVDRDPPHVSFTRNPAMDFPGVGMVGDHAYWLDAIQVRDAGVGRGTVDVFSHGFGVGDAPINDTERGGGVLSGGTIPGIAFTSQSRSWGQAEAISPANRLDIIATNIAAFTVNPSRARVDCNADLNVTTDGPLTVTLAGCGRSENFAAGG